jgi:hypothetical protein
MTHAAMHCTILQGTAMETRIVNVWVTYYSLKQGRPTVETFQKTMVETSIVTFELEDR